MRASTIIAIIAPVAFAANTTIVAPGCTTVAAVTGRPTGGAASTGGAPGMAGNGTVGGGAGGAPKPTSTIVTAGASQQVASFAFMGVMAAGAAFIL